MTDDPRTTARTVPGTFDLHDLGTVHRLGFGAMRIVGEGVWGEPADRTSQDVLDHARAHGIGFIPWAPIAAGELARPGGPVDRAAQRLGATTAQVALAWLLRHSPVLMPIPGTASLELGDATYAELTAAG